MTDASLIKLTAYLTREARTALGHAAALLDCTEGDALNRACILYHFIEMQLHAGDRVCVTNKHDKITADIKIGMKEG